MSDTRRELLVSRQDVELVRRVLGDAVDGVDDGSLATVRLRTDAAGALTTLRARCFDSHGWVPNVGLNRSLEVPVIGQPQDSAGQSGARPASPPGRRTDSTVGSGVTVGIVDTRVYAHPWLYGAVLADPSDILYGGPDVDTDSDRRLDPQAAHATFSAGLVLRQAPGASVRVDHALDNEGHGTNGAVLDAAVRLAEQGVDVLNLSLGCYTDDGREPFAIVELLRRINPDIVIVAAAGNRPATAGDAPGYGPPRAFWPAASTGVVAVAAVQEKDGGWVPAEFSNYGPWVTVAAPGVNVESTFVDFQAAKDVQAFYGWALWSGSSFSTAIASGSVAAAMSQSGLRGARAVEHLLAADAPQADFAGTRVPVLALQDLPRPAVVRLSEARRPVTTGS